MTYLTFGELQRRLLELFRDENYEAVRELAAEQIASFPEQFHILAYWQMIAATRQKEYPAALQVIRKLLERGFWFGEAVLLNSQSLQPLQELPEFNRLVEASRALRLQSEKESFPLIILRQQDRCQKGSPPCPLMIALHTDGGSIQDSLDFWKPAAAEGWIAAAPESSQVMWKGAYIWKDHAIAAQDIQRHFSALVSQYAIDENRVVLAGHSLGGETAAWLALTGEIPVQGFIAFNPAGPLVEDPEIWQDLYLRAAQRGLRGYIIVGEEDEELPQENIRLLVDLLNEAGIPAELESVAHAGNDYDPVYDDSLLRALEFIFPQSAEG